MLTVLQLSNGYMEMNRDIDVVNMSDVMNECECEMMIMWGMSMKVNWLWCDEFNGYKQCLTWMGWMNNCAG